MTDKTIGTLNRLIAVCRDGEEFYSRAADKVDDTRLQEQFRDMAKLHQDIGAELRPYVARAGGTASEGGTLAGQTRQIFATLKTMFAGDKTQTLISELETAEEAVVEAFQNAVDEPIDDEARERVKARLEDVRQARERMRQLEQSARPA
jgi:uncharacterized protein (TIGR02284 family)